MNSRSFSGQQLFHFRQWSRKSYAAFNSLKKVIKISRLNVAISLVLIAASQSMAQDSYQPLSDEKVELEELEVTAQAEPLVFAQVGRVITTITKQEIESAPVSDLASLLSFVQSVDIRQRGGLGVQADVSIRGGSFDQVLVLLNGIPISDPQTGHFNLNIPIDVADIQKVEVLKGPGARVFGPNAFSGAINIITKAKQENSLNLRLSGGQHALYHYGGTANLNYKNWSTLLSYNQKGSDGYMENTDFKSQQSFIQSTLQLKALTLDAQLGFLQKAFGANSFYSPKYTMQYEKNESRTASLGFHFGSKVRVSILPYYRQHRDNWQLTRENPDLYQNFHQTDVYGGRAKVIIHSKLGKTTTGINFKNENLLSSSMGEKLDVPMDISWSKDHQFKFEYQRNHAGIYLEHSKTFLKKWNVSLGLLAHWYTDMAEDVNIYPGIDISYQSNEALKLFASVNNAMRLPTFTDLFYSGPSNLGNTDLKPEKSLTFEVGAHYKTKDYELQAAVYRRQGHDIIDWIWQDSIWKTQNLTQLTTNGLELSAQFTPASFLNTKWWKKFAVDYTYIDLVKEESDVQSKYALNNLKHQFNIMTQFEIFKNLTAQIQASYKDRMGSYQTYDFDEGIYVDQLYTDYWSVNAKVSWQYKSLNIFVEANNLTDVKVVEFGVPQAGFWLMGGVAYRVF